MNVAVHLCIVSVIIAALVFILPRVSISALPQYGSSETLPITTTKTFQSADRPENHSISVTCQSVADFPVSTAKDHADDGKFSKIFIPQPSRSRKWNRCHKLQVDSFAVKAPKAKVILYGDSITERWLQTAICRPKPDANGNAKTFQNEFIQRYRSATIFAIAGDPSSRLLWRTQHNSKVSIHPRAVVLHIGINDLRLSGAKCFIKPVESMTAGEKHDCRRGRPEEDFGNADVERVFASIKLVIKELWWQHCQPIILFPHLFPTGYNWPNNAFGNTVPHINKRLMELEKDYVKDIGFHTVNCSLVVLDAQTGRIDPEMMPDYLHPSPKAMVRWASCITQKLDTLLSSKHR